MVLALDEVEALPQCCGGSILLQMHIATGLEMIHGTQYLNRWPLNPNYLGAGRIKSVSGLPYFDLILAPVLCLDNVSVLEVGIKAKLWRN